jgi:predicted kinase
VSAQFPRVLLLGGAPMSGKSIVARVLGERHDRLVIATDDLGAAVRAVTAIDGTDSEDYREYYVSRSVECLWREALAGHRRLGSGIEAVAFAHAIWAEPAILEGWAIMPDTLAGTADMPLVWLIADRATLEARVRAEHSFWAGASDEDAMISNFVGRSMRLNEHLSAFSR